jgi:hypothetical protein
VRGVVQIERTHRPDQTARRRLDTGFARFRRLYEALAPLFATEVLPGPAAPAGVASATPSVGPPAAATVLAGAVGPGAPGMGAS